jgi:hypothetical protein
MPRYTVTITDFAANNKEHTAEVEAPDDVRARRHAIWQIWGSLAFWQHDSGPGWAYGRVFERLPDGQNTSRTGRARVDVQLSDEP